MRNIYRILVMAFAFGILGSLGAYETNSLSLFGAMIQASFCGISLKALWELKKSGFFNKRARLSKRAVEKKVVSKAA
ncbi:MAG: hypothetical protein PWQ76_647 [Clostridiales bacterium]|jgi:hypothetical protein|nr:hypothetical protein [Oscillospiraceae bacterium]MDN5378392.1 hypothetical protein [Clostridiales bacterium]